MVRPVHGECRAVIQRRHVVQPRVECLDSERGPGRFVGTTPIILDKVTVLAYYCTLVVIA